MYVSIYVFIYVCMYVFMYVFMYLCKYVTAATLQEGVWESVTVCDRMRGKEHVTSHSVFSQFTI